MARETTGNTPLVSIVMPAYKDRYLLQALESVLRQTYRPIELIVCDDARDDAVAKVIEAFRAQADFPIRYQHNEKRLWEMRSTARGVSLAQGEYVKLLHDDDVLHPDCIASLVAVMESEPGVSLASSRRRLIDEEGNVLPDNAATVFPFAGDVLIDGSELVSFWADHTLNFVGEPSAVLCRRKDLLEFAEGLSVLNGTRITWVADLALYVKLLRRGNLAMLAKPLTDFRISREQFSQAGRDRPGIGDKGHIAFRQAIRDLGWYRTTEDNRFVGVAPITEYKARLFSPTNLVDALRQAAASGRISMSTWRDKRVPLAEQQRLIDQHLENQGGGPRLGIMLIDRDGDKEAVERTLNSLEQPNRYRNLEVRVFSPLMSPQPSGPVQWLPLAVGQEPGMLNAAAASSTADWLMLVEAGVEFMPSGLLMAALDLLAAPPACKAVYADELMRQENDQFGGLFRPDFNLDLLLSLPASMVRHWLLRRDHLLESGGFSERFSEAYELEYALRLVEQQGLGAVGHISEPLLIAENLTLRDSQQEREVIERHLQARGYVQPSVLSRLPGRYDIVYGHPLQPRVSILIVVKDRFAWVQRCMDSLLAKTAYPNFEVLLLDHGNTRPELQHWLAGIERMGVDSLRVLRFGAELTAEQVRNQAATSASGDFLLWLGDGAGILTSDWLVQMLNHALRPEVGAVGAKLISGDGLVRHAGGILGLGGPVGRAFLGLGKDGSGYLQRLQVDQNFTALSGLCLMVRRELFIELGGFVEEPLLSRWADADLCLRIQQRGYLNVWTPRAQLLMDEPPLSPASAEEEDAMYARWLPALAHDPAYNPNFALSDQQGFKLAPMGFSWKPLQALGTVPLVLAHNADEMGCGHYRILQPHRALKEAGLIDGLVAGNYLTVTELERYNPDAIVLQRQIGEVQYEPIRRMHAFSRAFKVFELDDYILNIPVKSAHRATLPKDIARSLRRALACVDRFVVSTEPLAEALAGMHGDIQVARNSLDPRWWGNLTSERRVSSKPRVGWAGGISHTGDLEMVADVVRELAGEVEWVFFGMCPDKLRPYVHEYHPGVNIELYPAALAKMNLDLAIAPVEENLFNECKSNLRLLEYGACGFPVVCSDLVCYQGDLPVTRVRNRFKDWVDAIRMHLADLDATAKQGDALRAAVLRDWMLEGFNLERWRQVWLP